MARIFLNNERPHTEFRNILKVNDTNPMDYVTDLTPLGFKKYKPGASLEDIFNKYEPAVCSFTLCRKRLSLRQQLAGNRCENHPIGMKNFNNLPL